MNLKTYRGRTMADALAEVKKNLGPDAYILHTRSFRVGGLFGIGARPVVEITAADSPPSRTRRERPTRDRPDRGEPRPSFQPAAARAYAAASRAADTSPPTTKSHSTPATRHQSTDTTPPEPAPCPPSPKSPEPSPAVMTVRRTGAAPPPARASLEEEMAAVKRMVAQVLRCSQQGVLRMGMDHPSAVDALSTDPASESSPRVGASRGGGGRGGSGGSGGRGGWDAVGAMPDALCGQYLKLLEGDVAADIADELIGAVRDELTPGELADEQIVRQTVLRHLAGMIPVSADVPRPGGPMGGGDGRPYTLALIGPTGVGKTTTVAKLAAAHKLRHGKSVGLITTDTYRIAAVDQLRMYAGIIGLPLKVVMSPEEMGPACESLRDRDVILIDTAGRSQRDAGRLDELARFMDAARPHETHLVLSGTASERVMLDTAQRFASLAPNRVIFTKLDEAVNFGVLLNVARRVSGVLGAAGDDLRLSYVTTGQEVPDHIEPGRADRLARLILDGADAGSALGPIPMAPVAGAAR